MFVFDVDLKYKKILEILFKDYICVCLVCYIFKKK